MEKGKKEEKRAFNWVEDGNKYESDSSYTQLYEIQLTRDKYYTTFI